MFHNCVKLPNAILHHPKSKNKSRKLHDIYPVSSNMPGKSRSKMEVSMGKSSGWWFQPP